MIFICSNCKKKIYNNEVIIFNNERSGSPTFECRDCYDAPKKQKTIAEIIEM